MRPSGGPVKTRDNGGIDIGSETIEEGIFIGSLCSFSISASLKQPESEKAQKNRTQNSKARSIGFIPAGLPWRPDFGRSIFPESILATP